MQTVNIKPVIKKGISRLITCELNVINLLV